ncbi:hypothetical protein HUJ05_001887 [Dendroctonus ponderosae]|nr:hypothetical protein HUJ05_001887 [Dendroctonus ponderosae]
MRVSRVICKKSGQDSPELSFHRFPKDKARRKIWFGFLNFDESTFLKSKAVVCSEHFDPSDMA